MTLKLNPEDSDSPEMIAFKENAAAVMRKLAKAHGWCDVAEKGLVQANIIGPSTRSAVATVTLELEIRLDVPVSEYSELDEAAQNIRAEGEIKKVLETTMNKLPVVNNTGGLKGGHAIKTLVVEDLNNYVPPPPPPSAAQRLSESMTVEIPAGYGLGFTSNEGRVAHVVPLNDELVMAGNTSSICGTYTAQYSNYYYTRTNTDPWATDSDRSEGRLCAECERKLPRLTALR